MNKSNVNVAHRRLQDLRVARVALRNALAVAFPVGTQVISHARAKPILGVVTGICGPSTNHAAGYTTGHYDGYVIVENLKTGKRHQCFALDPDIGLELES